MENEHQHIKTSSTRRLPWNKGKLIGAKPPLRPSHVWSIRTKLQMADRKRDLALSTSPSTASFGAVTSSPCASTTWRRADMPWIGRPSVRRRRADR